jgi:2-aminoadipate transaminase
MTYDHHFAKRTASMKRSTIREILKLTGQPDVISFAGGLPAPEFFPTQEVADATEIVMAERGQEALQYSTTEGMPELRAFIADRLSGNGVTIPAENVLIISGSQQGLDLAGRILIDEGDRVFVENPTYLGTLMAWMAYGIDYCPIPTDKDGLIVDAMSQAADRPANLMYVVPNFQNPQGVTLAADRRDKLIQFIHQHDVLLMEDNPYGELRYDGDPIPHLLEVDAHYAKANNADPHVIHAGTFSKVLTPGLRVGWVVAPFPIIDKLVQA